MDVFTAAPHHDIVLLLFQITVLLFAARACGEIVQRFGQPSVIGEILAGIILGPSLLSGMFPLFGELLIPQTELSGFLLEQIALIGAMFLLLITGLETDVSLIKRHFKTAISVSYGGIIVTFATGFALGMYLPEFLLADADQRIIFALFVGTAMSISAIPVIAKVLMDMKLIRRDIGQTILAAGMSDDTTGWILLSIVAGLASGAAITLGSVAWAVGSVLIFLVLSFTIGQWLFRKTFNYVQDEVISNNSTLSLIMIFMFGWGAMTHALNLEAVLGAFIMGIIVGRVARIPVAIHHQLESIALGIFAPIFFAVAGLKVNVQNLFDPTLILIAVLVIAIATVGKVVGTYMGARFIGKKDHWTSLSYGAGLNARGAMEIIIATIGLNLGVLSQDMFSIIVIMAMATSLMAPFALRFVLKRVKVGNEEMERLKKEEMAKDSFVGNIQRILLPVRFREDFLEGSAQNIEAVILQKMAGQTDMSITLMTIVSPEQKNDAEKYLLKIKDLFNDIEVITKVVTDGKPSKLLFDELKKDYDLLVIGATESKDRVKSLFNPMIDELIRMAPCPTLVVQGARRVKNWVPQRIMIPTNGTNAAKKAAEIGFTLATENDRVIITSVILESKKRLGHIPDSNESLAERYPISAQFVEELTNLGKSMDIHTIPMLMASDSVHKAICKSAEDNDVDLVIIGTDIRPGSHRLFLGPKVEEILKNANCPVLVLND